MARRQVQHYLMDIFRATGGQVQLGRVQQALSDSCKKIDQRGNWVFLGKTALISLEAPYSTGTVAVSAGGTTVTGNSTVWDPTWAYRDIKFGARELGHRVSAISGAGTLTIDTPLSGAAITAGGYVLYRARYPLPADCDPGRDIMLRAGIMHGKRGRIAKLTRPTHESRASEIRGAGNLLWYTDDDVVENRPTILIYPYPASAFDVKLFYYRRLLVPDSLTDNIEIPEAFEELPIRMTAARLKRDLNMQGWMEDEREAAAMMEDLYNRHAASAAYEQITDPDDAYGDEWGGIFGMSDQMYTWGPF